MGPKNTSTYFFHSTSVPPSLKCFIVFEKKPDDQICPVCAFYNLGRRRLCSYRRAAFGRPRRLTLSSLLRTAKVLFSSLLVLAFILESDPRKKTLHLHLYDRQQARISIYDTVFQYYDKSLQYTNMYDFSLYYWILFLRAKR